jgi:hypothetical protein
MICNGDAASAPDMQSAEKIRFSFPQVVQEKLHDYSGTENKCNYALEFSFFIHNKRSAA